MANSMELVVPDLGDFDDVEVIEVLVSVGDVVAIEDLLKIDHLKQAPHPVSTALGARRLHEVL